MMSPKVEGLSMGEMSGMGSVRPLANWTDVGFSCARLGRGVSVKVRTGWDEDGGVGCGGRIRRMVKGGGALVGLTHNAANIF